MDGDARQENMAEQLKREVKQQAHRRREQAAIHVAGERTQMRSVQDSPTLDDLTAKSGTRVHSNGQKAETSTGQIQRGPSCSLLRLDSPGSRALDRADTILLMFYLETLLPFMFPCYSPSPAQGGRAWILEMIFNSPVLRQVILCQGSYFFSLASGNANCDAVGETLLTKKKDAFEVLRQALQVIVSSTIEEHLHGAVRILASIMQVQRLEVAISCFDDCQAHLNAAVALFKQLLDSAEGFDPQDHKSRCETLFSRLGPSTQVTPNHTLQIPSAEQAAMQFSSALLILDDIVASTVLRERP